MATNFLTSIGNALTQLYASQGGFFSATGLNIFWSIVAINFFLIGLDAFTGRLTEGAFVQKMGMILLIGSIMGFYTTPIPGVGVTFPHVLIDEAKGLSDQLEGNAETLIQNKLNQAMANTEQPNSSLPSLTGLVSIIWYTALMILIAIEKLVMIAVLGLSYIAIGLIVLLGPMFIPWALFPGLEEVAWHWFKALLQYCLYQVIAGGVVYLNSIVLFAFFDQHPYPWRLVDLPTIATELFVTVGISIYVTTWVPSISATIIGGHGTSSVNARTL